MARQTQNDLSGGMIDTNVSLSPLNTLSLGLNVDFDREIGSAVTRLGTSTIGSQLVDDSNSILGLHQHIDTDTSGNNKLFATVNASGDASSVIYDVVAGSTSQTGLTASKKMRYLTFNTATLAVNGEDAERSYTSAGWITTGGAFDLANIPSSNKVSLCIEFLDRVYVAGDTASGTTSRLYYSGVSNGTAVSWTSGNGFVDIEPESGGGPITALSKVPGYILIFKERSLHRWNFNSAFPEGMVQIGAPNQESVVSGAGLCAFYSNSNEGTKGFYLTNGGRPQAISHDNTRPIKKWVDAIASANEANIAGWATDRYFCWSVGDITVDGETFTDVVFKYNFKLNQWSIRSYPTQFKVFTTYLVSGVNTTVGGDDDGTVYRVDTGFSDALKGSTVPIHYKVRQNHLTYNENRDKAILDRVVVRGKNIKGSTTRAYIDESLDPVQIGSRSKGNDVLSVYKVKKNLKGSTIAIEVAGDVDGAYSHVREIELVNIQVDNNYA